MRNSPVAVDPLRRKALACIREGRVTVLAALIDDVVTPWAKVTPVTVLARVLSSRDRHPYRVMCEAATWSCDCREGRRDLPCAHIHAVQLVTTGVPS